MMKTKRIRCEFGFHQRRPVVEVYDEEYRKIAVVEATDDGDPIIINPWKDSDEASNLLQKLLESTSSNSCCNKTTNNSTTTSSFVKLNSCWLDLDNNDLDNVVTGVTLEHQFFSSYIMSNNDDDDDSISSSSTASAVDRQQQQQQQQQPQHRKEAANNNKDDDEEQFLNISLEAIWNLRHIRKLIFSCFPEKSFLPFFNNNKIGRSFGSSTTTTLLELEFNSFRNLLYIPNDIERLHNLKSLTINSCQSLQQLPPEIGYLKKLSYLRIENCSDEITSLPNEFGLLENLETLHLEGLHGLVSIPSNILSCSLKKLKYLFIKNCSNLSRLDDASVLTANDDEELLLQQNLEDVIISLCYRLENIPQRLKSLRRLQKLNLSLLPKATILEFFRTPWPPFSIDDNNGTTAAQPSTICLDGEMNEFRRSISSTSAGHRILGNDYRLILSGLPKSLKKLSLAGQGINDLSGFFVHPDIVQFPCRGLTTLLLDDNPVLDCAFDVCDGGGGGQQQRTKQYSLLKNLIESYPTLGHIYSPEKARTYILPDDIEYQLNLNRCGRILLQSNGIDDDNNQTRKESSIPISLWPTVLNQVKNNIIHCGLYYERLEKEASVLYSLLRQGPVLLDGTTTTTTTQQQSYDDHCCSCCSSLSGSTGSPAGVRKRKAATQR